MPKNKTKPVGHVIKERHKMLADIMTQLEPMKKTMRKRVRTRKLKPWIKNGYGK